MQVVKNKSLHFISGGFCDAVSQKLVIS